jgi:phosphatidylinositol glycan class T
LRWDPGSDRERPTVFEAQLLIPRDASGARVSATFEKAFLRLGEFPPDANRGFDLPPAVLTLPPPRVVRFDRAVDSGGAPVEAAIDSPLEGLPRGGGGGAVGSAAPPERAYAEGALLTLPTPDFSMPFNVITMVSTLMTVFVGAMVGVLTERQGWASFAGEKRAQRAKLAELRKKRKNDGAS